MVVVVMYLMPIPSTRETQVIIRSHNKNSRLSFRRSINMFPIVGLNYLSSSMSLSSLL